MKVTENDLELQSRFVDHPDVYGFGTTQCSANLSIKQIKRLLALNLIRECRTVNCEGLKDHSGFKRSRIHYCKNLTK